MYHGLRFLFYLFPIIVNKRVNQSTLTKISRTDPPNLHLKNRHEKPKTVPLPTYISIEGQEIHPLPQEGRPWEELFQVLLASSLVLIRTDFSWLMSLRVRTEQAQLSSCMPPLFLPVCLLKGVFSSALCHKVSCLDKACEYCMMPAAGGIRLHNGATHQELNTPFSPTLSVVNVSRSPLVSLLCLSLCWF